MLGQTDIFTDLIVTAIVTTKKNVENHSDIIKGYLHALQSAIDDIYDESKHQSIIDYIVHSYTDDRYFTNPEDCKKAFLEAVKAEVFPRKIEVTKKNWDKLVDFYYDIEHSLLRGYKFFIEEVNSIEVIATLSKDKPANSIIIKYLKPKEKYLYFKYLDRHLICYNELKLSDNTYLKGIIDNVAELMKNNNEAGEEIKINAYLEIQTHFNVCQSNFYIHPSIEKRVQLIKLYDEIIKPYANLLDVRDNTNKESISIHNMDPDKPDKNTTGSEESQFGEINNALFTKLVSKASPQFVGIALIVLTAIVGCILWD